jgi:hypothetical protein
MFGYKEKMRREKENEKRERCVRESERREKMVKNKVDLTHCYKREMREIEEKEVCVLFKKTKISLL